MRFQGVWSSDVCSSDLFSYSRNHQTPYQTSFDDVVYYKDTVNFAREAYSGAVEYIYRKGLYNRHYFSEGFRSEERRVGNEWRSWSYLISRDECGRSNVV